MLLLGLIACMMSGNAEGAMEAMLAGAGEAVTLSLSLAGAYMLWMGLMNVAKEAGLIDALARAVRKPLALLFPNAPGAVAPITLNLAANFFGMGSAATPFGLAAMKELRAAADREGVPEGAAARAFYQKLGFIPGRMTAEFGNKVQEFVMEVAEWQIS